MQQLKPKIRLLKNADGKLENTADIKPPRFASCPPPTSRGVRVMENMEISSSVFGFRSADLKKKSKKANSAVPVPVCKFTR